MSSNLHIRTPLIDSIPLRSFTDGRRVYLKLENCQPSGSCKLRGVAPQVKYAKAHGYTKVICSSAGNAGLAAAYASLQLGIPCHIVIPKTTPTHIRRKIETFGATVEVYGSSTEDVEARAHALVTAAAPESWYLIHPSHHELLFEGHSTMVDELAEDLGPDEVPSLIVSCCGGGGLVSGLVQGVRRVGWEKRTKILVMETHGAHCFNECVKARGGVAKLNAITSIASSLSVLQVYPQIRECFLEARPPLLSRLVTDLNAVCASVNFADDHRILVGPACGAAISAVYEGIVEKILAGREEDAQMMFDKEPDGQFDWAKMGPVVVIVCGGSEVTLESLEALKQQFCG